MDELIIIETVDDGEVGYLHPDGTESTQPPADTNNAVESGPQNNEHKATPAEAPTQQQTQQIKEELPVVYVTNQLPNTGASDYGFLTFFSVGLIFVGIKLLKKACAQNTAL